MVDSNNVNCYYDFESAIIDSRFIRGTIDDSGHLVMNKKESDKFRRKILEDYYNFKIQNDIFFFKQGKVIFFEYKEGIHRDTKTFKLDFDSLIILLFTSTYINLIGLRRCLLIAYNTLDDRVEKFISFVGIKDESYAKFMSGASELKNEITLRQIWDFYGNEMRPQDYYRITLKEVSIEL